MKTDWTIERITQECEKIAAKQGYDFNTPVKINGRLTRTLGRVVYCSYPVYPILPKVIEFSREFLKTASDESILSTIQHEMAHWLVAIETGESHGHDAVFKSMCARVGCSNDKASTKVERVVDVKEVYKYAVYCPNCGVVARYKKKGKVIKNIDHYKCSKCGSGHLNIREETYEG